MWLGLLTGSPMTIAVDWDVKKHNKQNAHFNLLPFVFFLDLYTILQDAYVGILQLKILKGATQIC